MHNKQRPQSNSMRIVRAAGLHILKDGGAWVSYKGNTFAPRGHRITKSHTDLGIRHLDIYYAVDEECPWKIEMSEHLARKESAEYLACEYAMDNLDIRDDQLTKVTLVTGHPEKVCAWAGEVAPMTQRTINDLLANEYLEIVQFKQNNVIWDEETRDLIGGLMLDGMSMQEAQAELVRAGEMKVSDMHLPGYFYRPIGAYRATFVED